MVSKINTVAFQGIEARPVDVQVMIAPGKMHFSIVGLPDKAVAESRERVQAALHASGLSLPHKRITVNLAPADLPKEGSHYDLPIALGLMAGLGAIPSDVLNDYVVLGELSLDGSLANIVGALPAAIGANARGKGLICPGQETAKRALEIAAAGGHNLLMAGPPGSGKSMLAARLPGILPDLTPAELLEVSMVSSIAGELADGKLTNRRPFRAPHHSATMAAMVGGGVKARPGEVSLAHNGVLFLDEFPEFSPQVLDSLRQPLEAGETTIARANHRITYPSRIQLIAAMNPCRCGMAGEPGHTCKRGDRCATDYQARISGPLLDRIDLRVDVPAVSAMDMIGKTVSEPSKDVAKRVLKAQQIQQQRFEEMDADCRLNAHASASLAEVIAVKDQGGEQLLRDAAESMKFSARAYHRILKVARTIADLDGVSTIGRIHLAEAIAYRTAGERLAIAA